VLSIGKLSAGQARYYLEQGDVRVDAVDSIGDGVEEYYAGGAEARGTWIGSGGMSLGLSGSVDGDALRRVLALIRSMGRRCAARRARYGWPGLI
jgi:TrwC relaxase